MNASGLPFISVVIPTRPGQGDVPAALAARGLEYPADRLEVIVARGRQPSVQRNLAVREARGEILYFLDDDALPAPGNLRRALIHFQDPKTWMVGGPNICPATAPFLERVFAAVLGAWLAFLSSRARYEPVGRARSSGEKELILCNLIARKTPFLEAGGFDEALYPNEENALMDALQRKGGALIYDPEFIVERRPRPTLSAFIRMGFTYGRGRAEQCRLHPTLGSVPNFVPAFFCLYLALLPFLPPIFRWPLAFYALALAGQVAMSTPRHGLFCSLCAAPLVPVTHISYGLGLWRGLTTSPKPAAGHVRGEVVIERDPGKEG
ncbi:MAG: glycosyltransferase [Verrucomicrobia bacterium]|nr:glycosyltransferase [Verrucomicrobiota bacterium]MBI3867775.1 glycosyltransferase [Verrucomicrobiota bacterium]